MTLIQTVNKVLETQVHSLKPNLDIIEGCNSILKKYITKLEGLVSELETRQIEKEYQNKTYDFRPEN